MKILYFTNVPAPYRVEFFNLLSNNHEVTVLFDAGQKEIRDPEWYKNNKYKFKCIAIKKFGLFQLRKILKEKYDVVIIGTYASLNGAFLNIMLKMKKIKFYINADGGFIAEKESFLSKAIKTFFISKADYYLSTGKETNKYLTYYGADEKNISIYPFSSLLEKDILDKPISYQEKMELRKAKGYNYKRLYVSVGRFIKIKGYDMFLNAIKDSEDEDCGYLIIGGGPLKEEYEKIIQDNKIKNVHIIEFCQKDEVFNYYKMSDVFFFTSRGDVWGLVINEAMSCGLPIISSDKTLAAIELLDDKFIFKTDSEEEFKNKIKEMNSLTEEQLYDIGKENLEKIRKYTIEEMAKAHEKILKEKDN